jgi:glycosyltransferase involved in cell wall biosynthesis
MVVGDYQESVKQIPTKSIRDFIMKQYVKRNDYLFRKSMQTTDLLVNAPSLFEKYKASSKSIHQIRTTTLSESDFFYRTDVLQNATIRLLYTGRLDRAKGLFELVQAFIQLHTQNTHYKLDIVGWEDHKDKPIEQSLKAMAQENNVLNDITFHGKKRIGAELNALYQQADIYIIPSYHEGFPRTIWEAMANGLPVVATTVGAIPHYLSHQVNALLIEPKKVEPIIASVKEIVSNSTLRKKMIASGYALSKENTLEIQTEKMINILHTLK